MICPVCGSNIPDSSLRCPACRADLGKTTAMPRIQGSWCPICGASLAPGSQVCPRCGMPTPQASSQPRSGSFVSATGEGTASGPPQDDGLSEGHTNVIPRIESAIPSEPDPQDGGPVHDHVPNPRALFVAVAAAVALVGGSVLYITHPWDPAALDRRAKVEADTSMAGFPGQVKELQGQDVGPAGEGEVKSGDETTLEALQAAWEDLAALARRVDENERLFWEKGLSADPSAREDGRQAAHQISLDVSNLIDAVSSVDVTSGTYEEDAQNLSVLGNWLRNRMDALQEAWDRSLEFDDPAGHKDVITGSIGSDGSIADSFKALFDASYERWKPVAK